MNPEPPTSSFYDSEQISDTVKRLKIFLATAPADWSPSYKIKRFVFPNGKKIACVLWDSLFHITGTDIVKIITFRFEAIGRPITNVRKFEEGIFSDLRNLKAGTDATLEPAKSEFLAFLFRNRTIRTQKRQKIFYWFSVNHDKLFMDALDRDIKRELCLYPNMGDQRTKDFMQRAKDQCNGGVNLLEKSHQQIPPLQITAPLPTSAMVTPSKPTPGGLLDLALKAFEVDPLRLTPSGLGSHFPPVNGTQGEYNSGWINSAANTPKIPAIDWDQFSKVGFSSYESFFEDDAHQRVFSCPEEDCGATFKRRQHMIRHQQSHSGNRQFACSFEGCNKSFTRHDNLGAHERRCHPNYKRPENSKIKTENDGTLVEQKGPFFYEADLYNTVPFDQPYNRIDQSFYSL